MTNPATTPARPGPSVKEERWYVLRIRLLDHKPTVWRRLAVPERITLPVLKHVIQASFGWRVAHFHRFVINGVHYGPRQLHEGASVVDEHLIELRKALGPETRCFEYVRDVGERWHHAALVEERGMLCSARAFPPLCLGGRNVCPVDHWESLQALNDIRDALRNPRDARCAHVWEKGPDYDPERFCRVRANLAIQRTLDAHCPEDRASLFLLAQTRCERRSETS